MKDIESHCDTKRAAARECCAAPTLTRSTTKRLGRHRADVAASLVFMQSSFVMFVGITDDQRSYATLAVEAINR